MVSTAHRFLADTKPDSPALRRHVIVRGAGVTDLVYHDLHHGVVPLARSLHLWATEQWGGTEPGEVVTVRLTEFGHLDFSSNSDSAHARTVFDEARNTRPSKYGRRRTPPSEKVGEGGTTQTAQDSAEPAGSERAGGIAEALADSIDAGSALLNHVGQIAMALQGRAPQRFLFLIDDLGTQLETMTLAGQTMIHNRIVQTVRRQWLGSGNLLNTIVFYLDPDGRLEQLFDSHSHLFTQWDVRGPDEREVREALTRVARRHDLGISPSTEEYDAIVRFLASSGNLRTAMGQVARDLHRNGKVSLSGLLDLPPVDQEAVEQIKADLEALVGLERIKKWVSDLELGAPVSRARLEATGAPNEGTRHTVLVGNPGVGKTTVARIVARIYHALGLLPTSRFHEASYGTIVSETVGGTAEKMKRLIEASDGGVLFIDEAHQFATARTRSEDPNTEEAVRILVKEAWDRRDRLIIILGGYTDGLNALMERDEGLQRRFPRSRWFDLPDYTESELWSVLVRELGRRKLELSAEVNEPLRRLLRHRAQQSGFGNAGGVVNLIDEIQDAHDARVGDSDAVITRDDLPANRIVRPDVRDAARRDLENLIGLRKVKETIRLLEGSLNYEVRFNHGRIELPALAFSGPAGTGKTTAARLFGRYLYGMGLLQRDHLEETSPAVMRADYVGQTGRNVEELFRKARGGVLFIDEVYGLAEGGDGYAQQVIETLLRELESPDNRDTLVIVAGYSDRLEQFFRANPGLSSRFGREVEFEALDADECVELARRRIAGEPGGLVAEEEFFNALRDRFAVAATNPRFGNGRWVVKQIENAIMRMRTRVWENLAQYDDEGCRRLLARDLRGAASEAGLMNASEPVPRVPEFAAALPSLPTERGPNKTTDDHLIATLLPSVIHILSTGPAGVGAGTGFTVTADGLVLTNHHLVEGSTQLQLLLGPFSGESSGQVVAVDRENDLALIQILRSQGGVLPPPLPLSASAGLSRLHPLIVIGNAQVAPGEEARTVEARVGRNQQFDTHGFETDGAIEPGFSGGPLWDRDQGGVVGIVSGGRGQSVKIAVRSENAMSLLANLGYVRESEHTNGSSWN